MPLFLSPSAATFGTAIPLEQFPDLVTRHAQAFPATEVIEHMGSELVDAAFAHDKVTRFVNEVCKWGNYPGIAGRVLKNNALTRVAGQLVAANSELAGPSPSIEAALLAVNAIEGLGTPSFASKHLRFLRPDLCPVFDSVLQAALPYPFQASGYASFASDCQTLAASLNRMNLPSLARRPRMQWLAADVEAAIFMYVAAK